MSTLRCSSRAKISCGGGRPSGLPRSKRIWRIWWQMMDEGGCGTENALTGCCWIDHIRPICPFGPIGRHRSEPSHQIPRPRRPTWRALRCVATRLKSHRPIIPPQLQLCGLPDAQSRIFPSVVSGTAPCALTSRIARSKLSLSWPRGAALEIRRLVCGLRSVGSFWLQLTDHRTLKPRQR